MHAIHTQRKESLVGALFTGGSQALTTLTVRVIKGPIYEGRLAEFATTFANHRRDVEFVLSMYTGLGVDAANRALADLHVTMRAVDEKVNMLLLFRKLDTHQEKELMMHVKAKGGQKCVDDDAALTELSAMTRIKDVGGTAPVDMDTLARLKLELSEDVDYSFEKNMATFERKLEAQKQQLEAALVHTVVREGDRVITAVVSGPHDRIVDPVSFTCSCCSHTSQWLILFLGSAQHLERNGWFWF